MEEEKIIEERKKKIMKAFSENVYVKVFSITAIVLFVISLLRLANISFVGTFSFNEWLYLALAFFFSAVLAYFNKVKWMFIPLLLWLVFLGIEIRSLPMIDHGSGKPGLWDITTDSWTLGPDLDPFLFLRDAKTIVQQGSLPSIDYMRNFPVGFDNSWETQLLPYLIVYTYQFLNMFSSASVEYAAVIFPVIMFVLTILTFFLFVREVFLRKDEKESIIKANVISLISTFVMIVIPIFLPRTVAGIPEKESAAFFFMFLALYLFLKAWKSEKLRNSLILGLVAGISTALMGLIWGGVSYLFVSISAASFVAFILNRVNKKEYLTYVVWIASSFIFISLFTNRFSIATLATSLDTGLAFIVFFILSVHMVLWHTKLAGNKKLGKIKLPKNITSIIAGMLLLVLILVVMEGPGVIVEKISDINQIMFKPVTGRWGVTVAENKQPYFTEWVYNFGPTLLNFYSDLFGAERAQALSSSTQNLLGGIPIMFWLFFVGSAMLFKKMLNKIKNQDAWILTGFYVLFFFGLVFSRYAAHPALFDGEGFISKLFYYGSALLLLGALVYYYIKYHKEGNNSFEKIEFEFLLLFSLFVLCLFTARSAVRLIMVLGIVAPIFASFLVFEVAKLIKKSEDSVKKISKIVLLVVVGGFIAYCLIGIIWSPSSGGYFKEVTGQAYSYVPSSYSQQWQSAMAWVRNSTPQNAVFEHWWDYGYWVQTMGNRATVTDGGNAFVYWNYLTGRLVLTGDNQKDALEFSYSHNASYLIIDSSDIGKYGAFSSIGSNLSMDRYSQGPVTLIYDPSQVQEKKDSIVRIYQGAYGIEEDINYDLNGTKIFLPSGRSAIIAIAIETIQGNGTSTGLKQPEGIYYNQGKQYRVPLRYAYFNKQLLDFKQGLEATAYVIPKIAQSGQGIQIDQLGAVMYISPRVMRGFLAQKYILNDPFNKFPNFKIAYQEENRIVSELNSQGAKLNEFTFFENNGETLGPIKIWKINYNGDEKVNPLYLEIFAPKELVSWEL